MGSENDQVSTAQEEQEQVEETHSPQVEESAGEDSFYNEAEVEDLFAEVLTELDNKSQAEGEEKSAPSAAEPAHEEQQEEGGEEKEAEQKTSQTEEVNPLEAQLAELKKQNEEMQRQLQNLQQGPQSQQEGPQEEPKVPTLDDLFTEDFDAVDLVNDADAFKQFIGNVVNTAKAQAMEEAYRTLPQVTMSYVQQQQDVQRAAQNFYQQNPELEGAKPFVAYLANRIHSENPQLSHAEVLQKTAEEAKKALNLQQQAAKAETRAAKAPRVPEPSAKRASQRPALTPEEQDIIDTLDLNFGGMQ